jgi:hypothetical protein
MGRIKVAHIHHSIPCAREACLTEQPIDGRVSFRKGRTIGGERFASCDGELRCGCSIAFLWASDFAHRRMVSVSEFSEIPHLRLNSAFADNSAFAPWHLPDFAVSAERLGKAWPSIHSRSKIHIYELLCTVVIYAVQNLIDFLMKASLNHLKQLNLL